MAGQDNLRIVREIFAAWNAHDVEGLVKRLDTKTTWKSDAFPAPFSGHKGDSAVPSSSTSRRFPIFTLTSSRSSPPATVMWWAPGALREPTTVGTVLLGSAGDDQRRLGRVEDRGPWHCSCSVQGGIGDGKAHGVAEVTPCQDQKTDRRRTIGSLRPDRSGCWRRREEAHAQVEACVSAARGL